MKPELQSLIREIADELKVEAGYRFGPSALQARLDNLDLAESAIVGEDVIEDLLYVDLLEANGYDELPDVIHYTMIRNAFDLGVVRATLILQGAIAKIEPRHHRSGNLELLDIDLAHKHAAVLGHHLAERRAFFALRQGGIL
jgi:hypothetical protein